MWSGRVPGHRGASTGVRQSNRISIRRMILPPNVVRQTLAELPLRETTMALLDAVTALRASELVALKWKNVGWNTGTLQSEYAFVEGELKETKSRNNALPLAQAVLKGASSMARAHTLSLGRRLDLCQYPFPGQDAIHVPNPVPPSHSPGHRASIRSQEQPTGTDRLAHARWLHC